MLHIAVFGSGRGSNFQSILNAIVCGEIRDAVVSVVISNNSNAGILDIARAHAIPAIHLSHKLFPDEEAFVDAVLGTLANYGANFIVLAGYMKRLHPRIVTTYKDRIINIHPALLPKYGGKGMYGMRVHELVVANHEQFSGATVHMVDEEFDHGAIVLQQRVALAADDTPDAVASKVLAVEHEIYPKAVKMFAEGTVIVKDGNVLRATLN